MNARHPAADPVRILVVGRDELITQLARHGLTDAGFAVTTASTLEEALDIAGRVPLRAVVVDLDAVDPAEDVAQRLRGHRSLQRSSFVFLALRGTPAGRLAELTGAGCDFVSKPFHVDELVARVRACAAEPVIPASRRHGRWIATVVVVAAVAVAGGAALAAAGHDSGRSASPAHGSPRPSAHPASTGSDAPSPPASAPAAPPAPVAARPPDRGCESPQARGRTALRLVRDPSWLWIVHLTFRPGRSDLLAQTHDNRTVVFVRSCTHEPLREVAAAAVDQVGKLRAGRWPRAAQVRWLHLRGVHQSSYADFTRDVGSVAILWQLGTEQWWHSPWPPPHDLPALVRLLRQRVRT